MSFELQTILSGHQPHYQSVSDGNENLHLQDEESKSLSKTIMKAILSVFFILGGLLATIYVFHKLIPNTAMPIQDTTSILSRYSNFAFVENPMKPSSLWGSSQKLPYPTNSFWTNLVVADGDLPIQIHPYGVKSTKDGILVSYSASRRTVNDVAITDAFDIDIQMTSMESYISRNVDNYDNSSVTMTYTLSNNGQLKVPLVKGMSFVTVQYINSTPIIASDNMHITDVKEIDMNSSGHGHGNGQAYILTLGNFQRWFVYVSEDSSSSSSSSSNDKDRKKLKMIIQKSSDDNSHSLIGSKVMQDGYVRVAMLPPGSIHDDVNYNSAIELYKKYCIVYPIGMKMDITYLDPETSQITWSLQTKGGEFNTDSNSNSNVNDNDNDNGNGNLRKITTEKEKEREVLMFVPPHQLALMLSEGSSSSSSTINNSKSKVAQAVLKTMVSTKGKLTPIVPKSNTWSLTYKVPVDLSWDYIISESILQLPKTDTETNHKRSHKRSHIHQYLIEQLQKDLELTPIGVTSLDTYNIGKELARLSRIAIMSDTLSLKDIDTYTDTDEDTNIDNKITPPHNKAMQFIKDALTILLNDKNGDNLIYDKTYGGLVSKDGINNLQSDYGLGRYNDHLFHYGYFIYAAAVVIKYDDSRNFYKQHKDAMDTIVRDICNQQDDNDDDDDNNNNNNNNSNGDSKRKKTLFPFARHKDPWEGHSWASGLFPQQNGKGLESTSEAINAYYSCALYGKITNNINLEKFSKLLYVMEIQSSQYYWQMGPGSLSHTQLHGNGNGNDNGNDIDDIYDPYFAASMMVGNIGAFDVTATTWFGNNVEYVNGIQILPITPASHALYHKNFVSHQWPMLATRIKKHNKDDTKTNTTNSFSVTVTAEMNAPLVNEWKVLLLAYQAVIEPNEAIEAIKAIPDNGFGNGNSKTNTLMWALSCYDYDRINDNDSDNDSDNSNDQDQDKIQRIEPHVLHRVIEKQCKLNSACAQQGILFGDCCPAPSGVNEWGAYNASMLGCCPHPLQISPVIN
jgi:endoglucanase Acf2